LLKISPILYPHVRGYSFLYVTLYSFHYTTFKQQNPRII